MLDCFPFALELEFTAFCILDVTLITMLMPVCGVAYVLRIRLLSFLLLDCLPSPCLRLHYMCHHRDRVHLVVAVLTRQL